MSSEFYTFILDYKGGTYLTQIEAPLRDAVTQWAEEIDTSVVDSLDEAQKAGLVENVADEVPTPVEGMVNVWCVSSLIGDGPALVHIVKTDMPIQNRKSEIRN